MSDNQDIRVWAAANGWDIQSKGRLAADVKAAYEAAQNGHGEAEPEGEPMVITMTDEAPPAEVTPAAAPDERKPEPLRKPGLFQRKPKETGPKRRRVSIENILSSGWALGAMALARKPDAIPVARVLDMQAPVAGIIGEELLAGTLVDRILQPLARGGRKAELATALIGPPMLVGIMTARPELHPVLRPMLKMTMMSWMELSEPAFKKVQKRQEAWAERFGDVDLDAMIDLLWVDAPVVSEQEEENIRKAREQ